MEKSSRILVSYLLCVLYLFVIFTVDFQHDPVHDFYKYAYKADPVVDLEKSGDNTCIGNHELCLACLLNSALQTFEADRCNFISIFLCCKIDNSYNQKPFISSDYFSFDARSPPSKLL